MILLRNAYWLAFKIHLMTSNAYKQNIYKLILLYDEMYIIKYKKKMRDLIKLHVCSSVLRFSIEITV